MGIFFFSVDNMEDALQRTGYLVFEAIATTVFFAITPGPPTTG